MAAGGIVMRGKEYMAPAMHSIEEDLVRRIDVEKVKLTHPVKGHGCPLFRQQAVAFTFSFLARHAFECVEGVGHESRASLQTV